VSDEEEPPIPADDLSYTGDDNVLVFRGNDNRPVAVPQDVVIESERPYRAYHLHLRGLNWEQVALQEGYASAEAARYDVRRYLDEGRSLVQDLTRKQLLERELARLDLLQAAVWPKAMEGNLPAVSVAHGLVLSRAKLLRLDQDIRDEPEPGSEGAGVVIGGDERSYSAALEKAAER
jgi:hypothetical protein